MSRRGRWWLRNLQMKDMMTSHRIMSAYRRNKKCYIEDNSKYYIKKVEDEQIKELRERLKRPMISTASEDYTPPPVDTSMLESSGTTYRPANIVVYGHSYIKRLQYYLQRQFGNDHNLGLNYEVANITYLGFPGSTVPKARYEHLHYIMQSSPDIVYLELGGNDLCFSSVHPISVSSELHELVCDLLQLDVKFVIAGQMIFRSGRGIPSKMPHYNSRVMLANQFLEAVMDPSFTQKCKFWKHKGLWKSRKPIYLHDGVHLNKLGCHRLYRSLRGAIIYGIRRIRHQLRK